MEKGLGSEDGELHSEEFQREDENPDFLSFQISAFSASPVLRTTSLSNKNVEPGKQSPEVHTSIAPLSGRFKQKPLNWTFLKDGSWFDRQRETVLLKRAFQRRIQPNSKPEFILISGESGTGKTALASTLEKGVDAVYVRGKFDQLQRFEPYAPMVAAMTTFVKTLLDQGGSRIERIKESLFKEVGEDLGVLTVMVPILEEIVGKQTPGILKGPEATDRFKSIFKKFVRVSSQEPLVLVMDGLQWADAG